jgi:RNA polymerase-binding transcription factor DksA
MTTNDDSNADVRARLVAERAEVVEELEALRARLETKGDYELGEGDPMIYQWELNLALRERAEQHLAEIDQALEQLNRGGYGRCERCGGPIDPERLAVLPHTTVCSKCAQRRR